MTDTSREHRHAAKFDRSASAGIALACMIVSLLLGMFLAGLPIWIPGLAFALAVLLVVRRVLLCAILILVLCLGQKLYDAWRMNVAQSGFTLPDVLFAFSMLAFLASALRYLELDPNRFRWSADGIREKSKQRGPQQFGSAKANLRGISSSLLRIPVALLLVLGLLAVLPVQVFWPNPYDFDPSVYRTVIVVWLLIITSVVPASVVGLLKWRRLQAAQAGIYLRRVLAGEVKGEQRLVERARYRRQQRTSKRNR